MSPRKPAAAVPAAMDAALWTDDETAKFLQISAFTVQQMARRGELPSVKIGRFRRYEPTEIRRYVASR